MLYRITIQLAFTNQGVFQGLKGHALGILDQAVVINPGQLNQETGFILIEECYHDEDPAKPCQVVEFHEPPSP